MTRLINHKNVPPGNYSYHQDFELGGKKYRKAWPSTPEITTLAAKAVAFRKANNLPRANIMDALEDVDKFTCDRIGNNPKWCHDTDVAWDSIVATQHGPGCSSCGGTPSA